MAASTRETLEGNRARAEPRGSRRKESSRKGRRGRRRRRRTKRRASQMPLVTEHEIPLFLGLMKMFRYTQK